MISLNVKSEYIFTEHSLSLLSFFWNFCALCSALNLCYYQYACCSIQSR